MNLLFLANAIILGFLGTSLFVARRGQLTALFLVSNLGLSAWNLCIFLTEELLFPASVDLIARLQLLAAMFFVNGYFYLCTAYPVANLRITVFTVLNALCFVTLAGLVFLTDIITTASVVGGRVVYQDTQLGYGLYTAYLMFFCIASLVALARGYRVHAGHRQQIKYLFLGIALFVLTAIVCDLILPTFGEYRLLPVGRLSAVFPSLFFSYVIIKHSFLDMEVVVSSRMSWLVTMLLMGLSVTSLYFVTAGHPVVHYAAQMVLCAGWALGAWPLQQFLLTSAKRKFIRGWYSTEAVIAELAASITQEKSRESIFRSIEATLDRVFEVEQMVVVVAMRDDSETLASYKVLEQFVRLPVDSHLIKGLRQQYRCLRVEDLEATTRAALDALAPSPAKLDDGVVLPFHSPEFLEGIVVLGQRSSERPYSESDIRFFDNLIAFLTPILYRLTPMETLESLYFENKQKLHEAEIQLIRAQKIESIVHATRQCHHEIRTPLNIIRLGVGRIKSLDELESFKQVAREEIDHALEIVEETLSISDVNKTENKRYIEVNVNDVIRRCTRLIDTMKYKVVMELGDVPPVRGYFSDLQVVITNLIHNAVEAMPRGGSLVFGTRVSGDSVIITVEDTGEGIPEELKSRVWEPYFSGRAGRTGNSTAGRGWGLTIVNRIVTEHGGTIRFASEPGSGTRFTITLPMTHGERSGQDSTTPGDNVIALPRSRGG